MYHVLWMTECKSVVLSLLTFYNPVRPNISFHILHIPPCTFPLVLTGRIYLTIKAS